MNSIDITLTNSYVFLQGNVPTITIHQINEIASYKVAGCERSPAYLAWVEYHKGARYFRGKPIHTVPRWDGMEKLFKFEKQVNAWVAPAGLAPEIIEIVGRRGEVLDKRRLPHGSERLIQWGGPKLRKYQRRAVKAVTNAGFQRGILNLPVRAGKTVIGAKVIQELGVRAMFFVPSTLLLEQTYKALKVFLPKTKVGIIGGGHSKIGYVTVVSMQSMVRSSQSELILSQLAKCHLLIVDECLAKGTLIEMWDGSLRPIESVAPGDKVATPIGPRKVTRTWAHGLRTTITLTNGASSITCTPDHRLGVQNEKSRNWEEAHYCDGADVLCRVRSDRRLGDNNYLPGRTEVLRAGAESATAEVHVPLQEMWVRCDKQECWRTPQQLQEQGIDARENARKQSNEEEVGQREGHGENSSWNSWRRNRPVQERARWERESITKRNAGDESSGPVRLCPQLLRANEESPDRHPEQLQDRFRTSRTNVGRRNRRDVAPVNYGPSCRPQEGSVAKKEWMDRNQIQDATSPKESRETGDIRSLRSDSLGSSRVYKVGEGVSEVFDIEVEEAGCFFANGFLTHNCHHLRGNSWRKHIINADAYYKIGLSATIFEDHNRPQERNMIWLRGALGPVLEKVTIDELMKLGFLTQTKVFFFTAPKPTTTLYEGKYEDWFRNSVYENRPRNRMICDLAEDLCIDGKLVLIDTVRIKQAKRLVSMLKKRHVLVAEVIGSTSTKDRKKILSEFTKGGKVQCIVGTLLGEGVDIPELEVVIVGAGGKARTKAVQRMRNLTKHAGKHESIIIDFIDGDWEGASDMEYAIYRQSHERALVYKSVKSFKIRKVKTKPGRRAQLPQK